MMRGVESSIIDACTAGTPSLRRRAASFVLAVGINLLLLLALLTLNLPPVPKPPRGSGPILIDLPSAAEPAPSATQAEAVPEARAEPVPPARPAEPAQAPPQREPPPLPREEGPLPFIVVSREDFASSDIAKFANRPAAAVAAGDRLASASSRDTPQVGVAPNGEPLYQAEWHRRPTDAQLSGYFPPGGPVEGWGLVACRTVARYRVEDCVELADSPPGSRLAGAVRQAAWQFLVRPPRVGGNELVGSWVRIRIDYRPMGRD
jgi:hypothetical protein